LAKARRLRRDLTAVERKLWEALRKRQLGIRRQVPMGRYVADFLHHGARLVIEVDSGWHDLPEVQAHDAFRDDWFEGQGYRTVRLRGDRLLNDPNGVADEIEAIITRALSLNGRGLGEGVSGKMPGGAREAVSTTPHAPQSSPPVETPPSPALPPLRGKGASFQPPCQDSSRPPRKRSHCRATR